MSNSIRVLGIDLAVKRWRDNGSAILTFTAGNAAQWQSIECGCIQWPAGDAPSVESMADVIERTVREQRISAVSLDGPQGWREPNAAARRGVGRVCEYLARCQGKTGEFGRTYPQTQFRWIDFCIKVFEELRRRGAARIVNSVQDIEREVPLSGIYFLLECFPTSTWRESNLVPLPGKRRVGNNTVLLNQYWMSLQQRYQLPPLAGGPPGHDDLQAIVAALPAAGLLSGPCQAISKGTAGREVPQNGDIPAHWVEGVIWDATLSREKLDRPVFTPQPNAGGPVEPPNEGENPLLLDDRDDEGEELLERGVRIFRHLAERANAGEAVGIGYAQLVCAVHGVQEFRQVANRKYSQSDTRNVLWLTRQITEAAGGSIALTRNNVTINADLDAFVWRKQRPHARPSQAFNEAEHTQEEWLAIFPDGERHLLTNAQCDAIAGPQPNLNPEGN